MNFPWEKTDVAAFLRTLQYANKYLCNLREDHIRLVFFFGCKQPLFSLDESPNCLLQFCRYVFLPAISRSGYRDIADPTQPLAKVIFTRLSKNDQTHCDFSKPVNVVMYSFHNIKQRYLDVHDPTQPLARVNFTRLSKNDRTQPPIQPSCQP
jgi:hypothetical protein